MRNSARLGLYGVVVGMLLLFAHEAYGATIMVYVEHDDVPDHLLQSDRFSSAIEAGIIDVFFNAGHVAFDMDQQPGISITGDDTHNLWIRSLAHTGGASHIVAVHVNSSDTIRPVIVDWRFVEIAASGELLHGTLQIEDSQENSGRSANSYFQLGRRIANNIIEGW